MRVTEGYQQRKELRAFERSSPPAWLLRRFSLLLPWPVRQLTRPLASPGQPCCFPTKATIWTTRNEESQFRQAAQEVRLGLAHLLLDVLGRVAGGPLRALQLGSSGVLGLLDLLFSPVQPRFTLKECEQRKVSNDVIGVELRPARILPPP